MATLVLTDLPDDLAARLAARAGARDRSPAEEAVAVLRSALGAAPSAAVTLADLQAEARTLLSGETIDAFLSWRRAQWGA